MNRYCAIIPTFNNPNTIVDVARQVARAIGNVIVVDDGSDSAAREAAKTLVGENGIEVIFRPQNGGKGAALMTGFLAAKERNFTHALQIDADGQHDVADIPNFLAASQACPTALVLGQPIFDSTAPKSRLWARRVSIFWCSVETMSRAIGDPLCGYRVYPIDAAIRSATHGNGMDFDVEIAVRIVWQGAPIVHVPTHVRYFSRESGGVSHFRPFRDTWLISKMHTRLFFEAVWRAIKPRRYGASRWNAVPEVGTALGIRFVAALADMFGRRAASGFVFILAFYYALLASHLRHASRDYLSRVGIRPTFFAVVKHFWYFARVSLDRYLFLTGRVAAFDVHLHGHEHVAQAKGALLIGSHLGSFEAMRALANTHNIPLSVVVDFKNAKRINGVLERLAPSLRVRMIEVDSGDVGSIFEIKECIKRGELVAILADRVAGRSHHTVDSPFLGSIAPFPAGPFILAHLLGCPVFATFALFSSPNRYDITCVPFADTIRLPRSGRDQALRYHVGLYAEILERYTRSAPFNWFNFYDFWK